MRIIMMAVKQVQKDIMQESGNHSNQNAYSQIACKNDRMSRCDRNMMCGRRACPRYCHHQDKGQRADREKDICIICSDQICHVRICIQ